VAKRQGTGAGMKEDDDIHLSFYGSPVELAAIANNIDLEYSEIGRKLLSLGLKPNEVKIEYFGTEHYAFSFPPVPPWPGVHFHWVAPYKIGDNRDFGTYKSWHLADADAFYRKKINVYVSKKADKSKTMYPLFGKWLGLEWPELKAIASAAYYNSTRPSSSKNYKGPSFTLMRKPWKNENIRDMIDAYRESENGGWYVQLVQANGLSLH
jgi:hypothetical protein